MEFIHDNKDGTGEKIIFDGLKVVDIVIGNRYEGCRCSVTDRNRYDKESQTIICGNYSNCLRQVLRDMTKEEKEEVRKYIDVLATDYRNKG